MKTKKYTYLPLARLALTAAGLTFAATAANAALYVNESFVDLTGGTGVEAWSTTSSGSGKPKYSLLTGLTFPDLPAAGSSLGRDGVSGQAEAHATLTDNAAYTTDTQTIWFSVLLSNTTADTTNAMFTFGSDAFTPNNSPSYNTTNGGNAFGVFVDGSSEIKGISISGGTITEVGSSTYSGTGAVLIAGSISWTAGVDTMKLYRITDPTAALPLTSFATLTGTFDQATSFTTLAVQDVKETAWDEIRIGDSFADVMGVPEPSTTALIGLGGLALILRRRK